MNVNYFDNFKFYAAIESSGQRSL